MVHVLRQRRTSNWRGVLTTVNESASARGDARGARRAAAGAGGCARAAAAGRFPIPSPCPNEVYERAMAAAVERAVAEGFTHVAFGDLFLEDIRRYREERLAGTGLTPMFPLFGVGHRRARARRWWPAGLRARLTCVNPEGARSAFRRPRVRRGAPRRAPGVGRSLRRARRVPLVRLRRPDVRAADCRSQSARSSNATASSSPTCSRSPAMTR